MTYLWIALAALREISSREPQCVAALLAGLVGVFLTTRRRLGRAVPGLGRHAERGEERATGAVTACVR